MKKLLAMTLALTMSALMFASCGDTADDSSSAAETSAPAAESSEAETEESSEAEESEAETEEPEESEAEGEGEDEPAAPAEFDITKVTGYDENATETVFELTNENTAAWAEILDGDWIDPRSFERDKDMHMTIEWEYTEGFNGMIDEGVTDQHATQIVVGAIRLGHPSGWVHFGDTINYPDTLICDYPFVADCDDVAWTKANGEDMATPDTADLDKKDQVWPDVFVKNDGFLKIGNHDVKSVEFTITADAVNEMIDNALENGYDGISITHGGNMYVTKITIDQGNVFMHNTITDSGM